MWLMILMSKCGYLSKDGATGAKSALPTGGDVYISAPLLPGRVASGWRSVSLVLSLLLRKSPPPDHGRAVGSRRRAPHSYFSCGRGQEGRLSEPELQGRRDRVSGFKWWRSQFTTPP